MSQRTIVAAHRIARELRRLAPMDVRTGLRVLDPGDERLLLDEERTVVARTVARRRTEFASGRVLLRTLLGRSVVIPRDPNGAPRLPHGMCGSVAHDHRFVVAAIGAEPHVRALGIDIEPMTSLDGDVADAILRADDDTDDPMLAFVLKEAAYKAWSEPGRPLLDHVDVQLSITGTRFTAAVAPDGRRLSGAFAEVEDRWIALVVDGPPDERSDPVADRSLGR
ncbi:4'-phosphopantetheinyl transferase superfamily protein [soil metagenome]